MNLCTTTFNKSVEAGMAITLAAAVYLQCENKLIGSFLFSIGLLTVIIFQKKLYTGCTGYFADARELNDAYRHDFPGIGGFCMAGYFERFRELMVILFGNIVGTAILGIILAFSVPDMREHAITVMQHKEEAIWYSMLLRAVLCGALMQIAFWTQRKNLGPEKFAIAAMCIMAFILAGFEHSIADFAYSFIAWQWSWCTVELLGMAVIGNLIGGDQTVRMLD
jgi:formate/nitrite transporter FocA (FNT family)